MPTRTNWTEAEENILREKYPRFGTTCAEHLPGRSKAQITHRANMLGIKIEGLRAHNRSFRTTDGADTQARHLIDKMKYNGQY